MPRAECGFNEDPGASGSALLLREGPSLKAQVGLDQDLDPSPSGRPSRFSESISALIDTGALASCIDANLASSLNLPCVGWKSLGGVAGVREHRMHLAQILVPSLGWQRFDRFAAVKMRENGLKQSVLMGREFLAKFRMVYDGRTDKVVIENES